MTGIYSSVLWFFSVADPWYFIALSFSLFIFFLIGPTPAVFPSNMDDDFKLSHHIAIKIRQIAWGNILIIGLIIPIAVFAMGYSVSENGEAFTKSFFKEMMRLTTGLWIVPAFAMVLGFLFSFFLKRIAKPRLSAIKRRWSVKQSADELSDIRTEKERLKTKDFEPSKYFDNTKFFWGLDVNNNPVYDFLEVWRTRHFRLVGPTQTGKGVEIGVMLEQLIRAGSTVFFIDPKPDKFAKNIMKKACQDAGRLFIELDLRDGRQGRYEPFLGGDERQARSRLTYALGLRDTGTDGDFYKSKERRVIDKVFASSDRRLYSLKEVLSSDAYFSEVTRSLNYIDEWLGISTFRVNKDKRGFAVDKCFENNAVVYIRGDLDDEVINKACTVLLMEICQECKRLYSQGSKTEHATLMIDEAAFLINEQIADALATVAGFEMNIGLAYQSEGDLKDLKDKTLNAEAIASRVKVNCKNSLYYMAADADTAEVMAEESGVVYKSVTRSQGVKIGTMMEETWDNKRDVHKVDENLITANQAKMLPERVGILYRPNQLAEICHTCWVTAEEVKEEAIVKPLIEQRTKVKVVEDLPEIDKKPSSQQSNQIISEPDRAGAEKIVIDL